MKSIFTFIVLSIYSFVAFSQTTVTYEGIVKDNQNQAVAFATISLLNIDSNIIASTQSNLEGKYSIATTKNNIKYIKASYIGFDNFIQKVTNTNTNLNIVLKQNSKNLKSIDVVSEKKAIQNSIDKIVINADKLAVAAGGNATDVLKSAPAVTVDFEGNVALRGNKNVAILINGVPANRFGSDVTKVLQAMNASDIVSIEVINNPSAKYRAEGSAGVINIITKKKKKPGVNGSIELNATANPDANGNAQLGYNSDAFDVNASYSGRYWNARTINDYTYMIQAPDTTFSYESTFKGINKNFDNNASLNLGLNIDSSNRLDVGGWLFNFTGDQPNTINNAFYKNNSNSPFLYTQGNTKVNWTGTFWGAYLIHTHTRKDMSSISTQFFYSRGRFNGGSNSIENNITNKNNPNFGTKTASVEYGNEFSINLDYSKPITETSTLEAGILSDNDFNNNESYFYNLINNENFSEQPNNMFKWNYRLHVNGAYLSFSNTFNGLNYKLGLRAEHTLYNGEYSVSTQNIKGAYISFFPTIHLNYSSKKNDNYTLSYSRRITRPQNWQLSPWVFNGDTRIREIGNPDLLPIITNSFDFTYLKTNDKYSITTALYYRLIQNTFINLVTVDEDGISYQRLANAAIAHNIGLDLSLQWSPKKWFSTTINFNPRYEKIDENRNLNYAHLSYLQANANIMLNFNPTKWWLIQTQYDYTPKQRNLQGNLKSSHGLDIAMRWKVYKNNFAITLKCSDIFYTRRYTGVLSTYGATQLFNSKFQSRVLSLGFVYRFGMGNRRNREENLLEDINKSGGRGVR